METEPQEIQVRPPQRWPPTINPTTDFDAHNAFVDFFWVCRSDLATTAPAHFAMMDMDDVGRRVLSHERDGRRRLGPGDLADFLLRHVRFGGPRARHNHSHRHSRERVFSRRCARCRPCL